MSQKTLPAYSKRLQDGVGGWQQIPPEQTASNSYGLRPVRLKKMSLEPNTPPDVKSSPE